MRLLKRNSTGEICLTGDFPVDEAPQYAILSHTWETEEVSLKALMDGTGKRKLGYKKIQFCGDQAQRDDLQFFWVDTCCIDKSNSAELQEAINSMFRWYQNSTKCYVYLSDVFANKRKASDNTPKFAWESAFLASKWFTRGWTLQELLAPTTVKFFSREWKLLGDKQSLKSQIHKITGIPLQALQGNGLPLSSFSVDERFSWAANRQTTRSEDRAYCLLGIFDIQMPLIYGEGENNAFRRLREEIDKTDYRGLADLRITDPRHDKIRIQGTGGGLLRDSYRWVLDNAEFRRWRNDEHSRLLWIKGDPGKGKTMLLCGIVDELSPTTKLGDKKANTLLSYFFCQASDSRINNATAVLRGLIYLLAKQQTSLLWHVQERYKDAGKQLFEDVNAWTALAEIFMNILGDPKLEGTYIIIDALDECETGLDQLLKLIVQNTSSHRVKWIVSSRNRHDIEPHLKLDDSQTILSLELKANAEHVSHAVGLYIDEKVSHLKSLQNDDMLRDKVQRVLRHKADSTFLWVALVVQELENAESWDVEQVLEEVPTSLDQVYHRMTRQIQQLKRKDPVFCQLVLSAATLAYRPLHLLELGAISGLPDDISSQIEKIQKIVRMCGSFLAVRDDQVYIIHQSAKDYLSDKAAPTIFPSGRADVHRGIFRQSLDVMRRSLRRDIYGLRHPGILIDDVKVPDPDPLASVRYSCVHWLDHLYEARQRDDLLDGGAAHKFVQGFLLYWTEALSLCRAIPQATFTIAKLQRLLQTMVSESGLVLLTADVHRFLLQHGWLVRNAPLQVYVSALLFTPTGSLTRELFKKEEPRWVLRGPVVGENWSSLIRMFNTRVYDRVFAVAFSSDGKLLASGSSNGDAKVWDAVSGEVKQTLGSYDGPVNAIAFSPDNELIALGSGDSTFVVWNIATGKVKQTLKSHGDWVNAVTFLPNGNLVVSGSYDSTIKVWNIAKGNIKKTTLKGHDNWVIAVTFSSDGKLIASGSLDKTVKVWDTATGVVQQSLKGHSHRVETVAFSPDGKLIASGSRDKTVKVWDSATGTIKQTLKGHSRRVTVVAFSPNGKLIASGSGDGTVKVWDAATGAVKQTLKDHRAGWVYAIAFSPDGKLIASGSDRPTVDIWGATVDIWDATTGMIERTIRAPGDRVSAITFSPDSKLIASGSDGGKVSVWDATTGRIKQTLDEEYYSEVNAVAFSPDGELIALGLLNSTIKVWNVVTGEVKQALKDHSDWVNAVAFLRNNKPIALGSDNSTLKVWNATTGKIKQKFKGHSKWVSALAISPDGKLIASGSLDKTVKVWDTATGVIKQTFKGHSSQINTVAFSPDSKLIASGSNNGTIEVWNPATGIIKQTLKAYSDWVSIITFSPNGRLIASVSDNTINIWEITTGIIKQVIWDYSFQVWSLAFSSNSKLIASGSDDGIKVWNVTTDKVEQTLNDHAGLVFAVVFSPDGKLIASGSDDGTVKVWDSATGTVERTLDSHSKRVGAVAFSSDSKLIASGSYDKTIKVWDATTGVVKQSLKGHNHVVETVAFSPDGKLIASGSWDKTVKVWDSATGIVKQTFNGCGGMHCAVALSSDGKLVASGSKRDVKVWDIATGAVKQTFEGHGRGVCVIALSSDGKLVASGSMCDIKVWDIATGAVKQTFNVNTACNISFDTTGPYLLTGIGPMELGTECHVAAESRPTQPATHAARQHRYGLSPDGSWIKWNEHNVLCLPPEFRPWSSISPESSAVSGSGLAVAIGCQSGHVLSFVFDEEKEPL